MSEGVKVDGHANAVFLARVNSHRSKWTVIRLKVVSPDESKDKTGRSKGVNVDGLKILNSESWRSLCIKMKSKSAEVVGSKISKSENRRS